MKTISIIGAGTAQEFSSTSHKVHQDALKEIAKSIILGLGVSDVDFTVLYGLEAVVGSPDWEISPGAIYYNGEVYLCDGIVGNDGGNVPVLTISQTAIGNPSKTSTAGLVQTHFERKMVISFAAVDSADANYADLVRLDSKLEQLLTIDEKIEALRVAILGGADAAFDTLQEIQQALGDDADLAASLTAAIALKANKAQGAWTDITLSAGYSVYNGMKPQYRIDQFNVVHLRGAVLIDYDAPFVTGDGAVPNIPTALTGYDKFPVAYQTAASANELTVLFISNLGRLVFPSGFPAANVGAHIRLTGINYAQEAY